MGKRKKDSDKELALALQSSTKFWIAGVFSIAIAFFLVFSSFGKAGVIGETIFSLMRGFFGLGYFLFPFIFALLGILFTASTRPRLLPASLIGSLLILFSGLGFLFIIGDRGGIAGSFVGSPLVKLFDTYASFVILLTFFIVGLLVAFDKTPSFQWFKSFIYFLKGLKNTKESEAGEITSEKILGETVAQGNKTEGESTKEEAVPRGEEHMSQTPSSSLSTFKKKITTLPLFTHSPLKNYTPPPLSLIEGDRGKPGVGDIKANSNIIKRTLQHFNIDVEMDEVSVGPSVTRYALKPAQGVKLSRIVGLQNDLSLALAAHPIRIEAPIPGRSLVGIEIPNSTRITVGLASLFGEKEFYELQIPLLITLGRSVTGKPHFGNLGKMPHLLIAGATGSGKSVAIHSIISSLLYRNAPEHLRFILIDPKRVELTLYNKIPHLESPVITDAKKAILALKFAAREMDRRYDILEAEKVRDIGSYHKNVVEPAYKKITDENLKKEGAKEEPSLPERMPYIVIVIDELADIMSAYPRELEAAIVRLAQMSRAVGIHLILSTQRPSVNVITGLIKANIPTRMAFQVASQTDSRTILDMGGAEKLLGAGDMLYLSGEMSKPVRLQSAYVSENEIKKIVKYLSEECEALPPDLNFTSLEHVGVDALDEEGQGNVEDDLYEDARDLVIRHGRASTTFLQRKLRMGYARAASLIDMLEEHGVVGPLDSSKQREVLIKPHEADEYADDGKGTEKPE